MLNIPLSWALTGRLQQLGALQTSTGLIMSVCPSGQLLKASSNHIDSQYRGTTPNIMMHNACLFTGFHESLVKRFILKRWKLTGAKTRRDWLARGTECWWVKMSSQSINITADQWSGPGGPRTGGHRDTRSITSSPLTNRRRPFCFTGSTSNQNGILDLHFLWTANGDSRGPSDQGPLSATGPHIHPFIAHSLLILIKKMN